jgi:hypothetical protein
MPAMAGGDNSDVAIDIQSSQLSSSIDIHRLPEGKNDKSQEGAPGSAACAKDSNPQSSATPADSSAGERDKCGGAKCGCPD